MTPPPAPPKEGSYRARAEQLFPSWEGLGVGSWAWKRLDVAVSLAPSFLHARGSFDGRDDAWIGAATTNVPFHRANDFWLRRVRVPPQQRDPGHDHARRAVGALQCADLKKCLLQVGVPSINTVHAPHWPSPHPYFAPVNSRSSRSTLSRLRSASASTRSARSFT